MNIIETIVLDVEGELETAWKNVEGVVTHDAVVLWNDAKGLLTKVAPAEYTVLKGLYAKVVADVTSGDVADIETAVLNAAEQAGLTAIAGLGTPLLQAFLAMLKAAL